jgi:hypothetical protein
MTRVWWWRYPRPVVLFFFFFFAAARRRRWGTAVGESPQVRTSGLAGTSLPLLLVSQKVVIAEVMIMLMMKTMALMVMMAVIPAWLRRPVGCRCGPPVVNPWRTPASASFVP